MPHQYKEKLVLKQIGTRLRQERTKRGEKQTTVATDTGISDTIISRIESGTYPFSLDMILRLINHYDIDFNDVMRYEL